MTLPLLPIYPIKNFLPYVSPMYIRPQTPFVRHIYECVCMEYTLLSLLLQQETSISEVATALYDAVYQYALALDRLHKKNVSVTATSVVNEIRSHSYTGKRNIFFTRLIHALESRGFFARCFATAL